MEELPVTILCERCVCVSERIERRRVVRRRIVCGKVACDNVVHVACKRYLWGKLCMKESCAWNVEVLCVCEGSSRTNCVCVCKCSVFNGV